MESLVSLGVQVQQGAAASVEQAWWKNLDLDGV